VSPQQPPASTGAPLLTDLSFAQVVAAAVRHGGGPKAEPAAGPAVHVEDGLDTLDLDLRKPFAAYRASPSSREEIVSRVVAGAKARLRQGLSGKSFAAVKAQLMPLLEPVFAIRKHPRPLAARPFAGGLSLVYAVDGGSGRVAVGPDDLARWGVTLPELDRVAQANLVRRTEPLLCEQQLCGWASGDGYDATRMASAALRRQIVKKIGPAVYAVPREDVFVALPLKYADRIRQKVVQQFTQAERPVSPDVFVERGGKLVVLGP
jgi:uncharacterized protein YtpQ (UPF0354 family)